MPPVAVKALRAVLPSSARLMPVGGITPEAIGGYKRAGADAFGIGSALYKPGKPPQQIFEAAKRFAEAMTSSGAPE
jgi:2-dehydro-3-deoxyphosphogalactonate aldolase